MGTAAFLVCTRCEYREDQVPDAPNGFTPSAIATLTRNGDKMFVVPHFASCPEVRKVTVIPYAPSRER
jgi:hypothetical protein